MRRQRHLAQPLLVGRVLAKPLLLLGPRDRAHLGHPRQQPRGDLVANRVEGRVERRRAVEEPEVVQEAEDDAEHEPAPDVAEDLLRGPAPEVAVPEDRQRLVAGVARVEPVVGLVAVVAPAPGVVDARDGERADAEQNRKDRAAQEGARRRAREALAVAPVAPPALGKLEREHLKRRLDRGLVGANVDEVARRRLDREVLPHDRLDLAGREEVERAHRLRAVLVAVGPVQLLDVSVERLGDGLLQILGRRLHQRADVGRVVHELRLCALVILVVGSDRVALGHELRPQGFKQRLRRVRVREAGDQRGLLRLQLGGAVLVKLHLRRRRGLAPLAARDEAARGEGATRHRRFLLTRAARGVMVFFERRATRNPQRKLPSGASTGGSGIPCPLSAASSTFSFREIETMWYSGGRPPTNASGAASAR